MTKDQDIAMETKTARNFDRKKEFEIFYTSQHPGLNLADFHSPDGYYENTIIQNAYLIWKALADRITKLTTERDAAVMELNYQTERADYNGAICGLYRSAANTTHVGDQAYYYRKMSKLRAPKRPDAAIANTGSDT